MVERSTVIALALLYRSTATVALTVGHDSNDHSELKFSIYLRKSLRTRFTSFFAA